MISPKARLETALQEPELKRAFFELTRAFRTEGMSQLEMYQLFDGFRAIHEGDADGNLYNAILDTMDTISGWCDSSSRLYDTELPQARG